MGRIGIMVLWMRKYMFKKEMEIKEVKTVANMDFYIGAIEGRR